MKSWRTTLAGIITGLMIVLPEIGELIDGDVLTAFDIETVIGGFAAMGLGFLARDNGVTSEAAGAK